MTLETAKELTANLRASFAVLRQSAVSPMAETTMSAIDGAEAAASRG
jgi:hypothetical protein